MVQQSSEEEVQRALVEDLARIIPGMYYYKRIVLPWIIINWNPIKMWVTSLLIRGRAIFNYQNVKCK